MSIDSVAISVVSNRADDLCTTPGNSVSSLAAVAGSPTYPSFIRHAKLIGGLTLISRFMGLGREIVAGDSLGTGVGASAFTVAFTIPKLFRKVFCGGALSTAFISLYNQAIKRDGGPDGNTLR